MFGETENWPMLNMGGPVTIPKLNPFDQSLQRQRSPHLKIPFLPFNRNKSPVSLFGEERQKSRHYEEIGGKVRLDVDEKTGRGNGQATRYSESGDGAAQILYW